jgi:hypothetical protein
MHQPKKEAKPPTCDFLHGLQN